MVLMHTFLNIAILHVIRKVKQPMHSVHASHHLQVMGGCWVDVGSDAASPGAADSCCTCSTYSKLHVPVAVSRVFERRSTADKGMQLDWMENIFSREQDTPTSWFVLRRNETGS